jgi:hypothetical protein
MAEERRYRRAVRFVVEGVLASSGEESGSGSGLSDEDGGLGERTRRSGVGDGDVNAGGLSAIDEGEEKDLLVARKGDQCGNPRWSQTYDTNFSCGDKEEEVVESLGKQMEVEMEMDIPPNDVSEVPRKEGVEAHETKRWNDRLKLDALARRCYRRRFLKRAD